MQPAEALIEEPRAERLSQRQISQQSDESEDEQGSLAERLARLTANLTTVITPYEARAFREEIARERLREQFGVATLEAYGCEHLPLAVRAAGRGCRLPTRDAARPRGADHRAGDLQRRGLHDARRAHPPQPGAVREGRGGGVKGSLLWVLDSTRTPMGGRLLRRWLGEPLLDLRRLRARQEAVAAALDDVTLRAASARRCFHGSATWSG